jgi:hypothetical protein
MKKGTSLKYIIGSLIVLAAVCSLCVAGGTGAAFTGPEQLHQEKSVSIPLLTTIIESADITETGTAEPVLTTETITPELTPSPTMPLSTPTQTALGIVPLISLVIAALLMYNRSRK